MPNTPENPNGPDKKYNVFDQAIYDTNRAVNDAVPLNRSATKAILPLIDNPVYKAILGGEAAVDAVKDSLYAHGELSLPKVPTAERPVTPSLKK